MSVPYDTERAETEVRREVDGVRLCRGYASPDEGQAHNEPQAEYVVPIVIDPSLDTLGRTVDATIILREPDEQVLLHEVLHVLFDGWLIPEAGRHGHKAIALAEVALWLAGYRRQVSEPCCDHGGHVVTTCATCGGTGEVAPRGNVEVSTIACPSCAGKGWKRSAAPVRQTNGEEKR